MQTKEKIRKFLISDLLQDNDISAISDDDSLIDSGIIDSHGIMTLIAYLEKEFKIKIGPEHLLPENFESLMAISNLVNNLLTDKGK
jgi:acyl carrier protein